ATCRGKAGGCAVTSSASATLTGNAGVITAKNSKRTTTVPGLTATGQTGSQAHCPQAGCKAELNGRSVNGQGTHATGRVAGTGKTACVGQIAAGPSTVVSGQGTARTAPSPATARAPGAGPRPPAPPTP